MCNSDPDHSGRSFYQHPAQDNSRDDEDQHHEEFGDLAVGHEANFDQFA